MTEPNGNMIELYGVYRIDRPEGDTLPLIFDSPHSGTTFPADFKPDVSKDVILACADLYVDRLFAAAPWQGAVLLTADFPRVYIDANRAEDDIDPNAVPDWTDAARPSEKTALGKGLVWLMAKPSGTALYRKPLTAEAISSRIVHYYRPYHDALKALINGAHSSTGRVYHVNCHSMQPLSGVMDAEGPDIARSDIVLSDRDGATCEAGFLEAARESLRDRGLEVAVNFPFKGAEIVRRHGRPDEGRHSLQIEINRRLFLNLQTLEPSAQFAETKAVIDALIGDLAAYVSGRADS